MDTHDNGNADGQNRIPRPPPIDWQRVDDEKMDSFSRFRRDFGPMEKRLTLLSVSDALLKTPAKVAFELVQGRASATAGILLGLLLICLTAYGWIMGTFAGGSQLWLVPLKFTIGTFLSALICLPSLHIFASMSGGRYTVFYPCRI